MIKRTGSILALWTIAALLIGCSQTAATPTPTPAAEDFTPAVSVSGKVVPAQWANLSFQTAGRIVEVNVRLGDKVSAGQVLARLDDSDARAAVAQAEAALKVAQAQLDSARAPARPEQIAAATAAVAAAQAGLKTAQANLEVARANLNKLLAGPSPRELEIARQQIEQAKVQLWGAQAARDAIKGNPASTPGQSDTAEAAVAQAEVAVRIAELQYEELKAGPRASDIAIARAQVQQAEGQVATAEAQVQQAQAQLALLKAGPSREQIAVAEANVAQAQAALEAARAALAKTQLVAPFDGTVGTVFVHVGELATPGQPAIALGDVTALRVETTDLSEIDVVRVSIGSPATVTFDALPGVTFSGKVTRLAPMSTPGQSGVNYVAVVELEQMDPRIAWGMTAFVDIPVSGE